MHCTNRSVRYREPTGGTSDIPCGDSALEDMAKYLQCAPDDLVPVKVMYEGHLGVRAVGLGRLYYFTTAQYGYTLRGAFTADSRSLRLTADGGATQLRIRDTGEVYMSGLGVWDAAVADAHLQTLKDILLL